jgi:hypothetical protein
MEGILTVLGWLWRIVFGLFVLWCAFYVFEHLENRLEFIIVSLIGILYLGLRSMAILQSGDQVAFMVMMSNELLNIQRLLSADTEARSKEAQELQSKFLSTMFKGYVTMFFEGLVFLYCVYQLYIHL